MGIIEPLGLLSVWVTALVLWCAAGLLAPVAGPRDLSQGILRFTSLVFLAIGLLGLAILCLGTMAVVAWPLVMIVWWRLAVQYRAMQRRSLLSALALAVERHMPLAPMALAFADEHRGPFSGRVRQFAARLEDGMPLDEAVEQVRKVLPAEARLVAQLGRQSGDLAGALRAVWSTQGLDRGMLRPVLMRLFNLLIIVIYLPLVLLFLKIKIEPSLVKIVADFDRSQRVDLGQMSADAVASGAGSQLLAAWPAFLMSHSVSWAIASVGVWLAVLLALVMFYCMQQWRGALAPRLPYWKRIVNWVDMASVLRMTALAVRRDCPLTPIFYAIAKSHPKPVLRRRMLRVVRKLNDGESWHQGLRAVGLLRPADAAVVAAAQRNGNLGWALDEMAASFERRAAYRLQILAQFALPLAILPLGLVILGIMIGYFVPLVRLIDMLA